MKISLILIQPPFTQLNSPYPAIYYLKSFSNKKFKKSLNKDRFRNSFDFNVKTFDLGIELFHKIFSKNGLSIIFEKIEEIINFQEQNQFCYNQTNKIYDKQNFKKNNNKYNFVESDIKNIKNYILSKDFYINNIDKIKNFLGDKNLEFYHYLMNTNYFPFSINGNKILNKLGSFISFDEAKLYATILLEDLVKLINLTLDPNFELIKYSERKGVSSYYFKEIEEGVNNSFILELFYKDLIENKVFSYIKDIIVENESSTIKDKINFIIGITFPFPGNVVSGFFTAKVIKNLFNKYCDKYSIYFVAGGGYINTELRYVKNIKVFDYFDFFVFDSGFTSLEQIIESIINGAVKKKKSQDSYKILIETNSLYKTLVKSNNKIQSNNFDDYDNQKQKEIYKIIYDKDKHVKLSGKEKEYIKDTIPDYSNIDFSRYLTLLESFNKMYRLWSDSKFFKYYLAYGCYWHRCSFCDISLDYIKNYQIINLKKLFKNLVENSKSSDIRMIHFVDEALPLNHLLKFGFLNFILDTNYLFWGNIRFERQFNFDVVKLLSYFGFIGATAGIEIPVGRALKSINKGISIDDIIKIAYFFKSNNIAIHSYLIYGYYTETDQDIIDSMEFIRQMFENNLLDSGFWHRFVLTRHSNIYNRIKKEINFKKLSLKKDSEFEEIKVIENDWDFASNDLKFKDEEKFIKFDKGLTLSINSWIEGKGIEKKLQKWFDFKIPSPTLDKNFVKIKLLTYLDSSDKIDFNINKNKNVVWIGSDFLIKIKENKKKIFNKENKNIDHNLDYMKNVTISWVFQNETHKFTTSFKWAILIKEFLEKNSINRLKEKYKQNLIKNSKKNSIEECVDLFIRDFNSNNLFSKFSDFKMIFENKTGFPFDMFINSKNFAKLKSYGLLLF